MTGSAGNAPAWLFAFVDLAFLLLLGMTQLGGSPGAPDLGELVVPRIDESSALALPPGSDGVWQLRVYPRAGGAAPYELIDPDPAAAGRARLDAAKLRVRLSGLREQSRERPLLAPHADSRSQDLLEAISRVEELWPGRRRAMVTRLRLPSQAAAR
jgi:hypothetical protein